MAATFHNRNKAPRSLPIQPVQLYSFAENIAAAERFIKRHLQADSLAAEVARLFLRLVQGLFEAQAAKDPLFSGSSDLVDLAIFCVVGGCFPFTEIYPRYLTEEEVRGACPFGSYCTFGVDYRALSVSVIMQAQYLLKELYGEEAGKHAPVALKVSW